MRDWPPDASGIVPYLKLWTAVQGNARDDLLFKGPGAYNERVFNQQQALDWFNAEGDGLGTFLWICQVLDTDPDKTRKRILSEYNQWKHP